ncbi:MAG: hypothetical protein GXX79_20960 [Actinomycetales bacterium]|nr:hypothetical protein [Actinomycetales bacterium]
MRSGEDTAWSTVRGVPRQVRIRYPRTATTPAALVATLLALAATAFVLGWLSSRYDRSGSAALRWAANAAPPVLWLVLLACLVVIAVALLDLVLRVTVRGRVVARTSRERVGDVSAIGRRRFWIVVDDGSQEPIRALRIGGDLYDWAVVGSDVLVRVSRLLRYVHTLEVRTGPLPPAPPPTPGPDGALDPRALVTPADAVAALGCGVRGEPLPVLSGTSPVPGIRAWTYLPIGALPVSHGRSLDVVEVFSATNRTAAAAMIPLIRDAEAWWPLGTGPLPRDIPGLGARVRFHGSLLAVFAPRHTFAVRVQRHGRVDADAAISLVRRALSRLDV